MTIAASGTDLGWLLSVANCVNGGEVSMYLGESDNEVNFEEVATNSPSHGSLAQLGIELHFQEFPLRFEPEPEPEPGK